MKAKHLSCACGCGELADECMSPGSNPLAAFTVEPPIGSSDWWPGRVREAACHDRPTRPQFAGHERERDDS